MNNKHNNPNEVTTTPTRAPIPARDNAGGDGVFSLACKIHVVVPPIWFAHGWASWRMRRGDLVLTGNVKREENPAPTPSLGEGASSQSPPPAPSLGEGVQAPVAMDWKPAAGCDCSRCSDARAKENPAPTPAFGNADAERCSADSTSGSGRPGLPAHGPSGKGADGERRPYRLCSVIVGGLAPGQKPPKVFASRFGRRWATAEKARLVAQEENERSPLLILTGVARDETVVWTPMGWPEGAGYRTVELVGGGQ